MLQRHTRRVTHGAVGRTSGAPASSPRPGSAAAPGAAVLARPVAEGPVRRRGRPARKPFPRPHPYRALVVSWRVAAVALLVISSVSAALLAASTAAGHAKGPAAAFALDAGVLGAAGLVVALTARRPARLAVAAVTAAQLLAFAFGRHAAGLPPEHGGRATDVTRLLCGGAAAVVTLALLAWLDNRPVDAP